MKRDILEQVAAGTLSPEEAAARLDELDRAGAPDETPAPATRIRVSRRVGGVVIIGDPRVGEAAAEGPHVARREGDALVIEGDELPDDRPWFSISRRDLGAVGEVWARLRQGLTVRVNPALPIDVLTVAGNCRISGVTGPIRAEVSAGALLVTGLRGPVDLTVQTGSLRASGLLDSGASRIRCDAGTVHVRLDRGSSVRINARSGVGRLKLPGFDDRGIGGQHESVVGAGAATLDVDGGLGAVTVEAQ